MPSKTNKASKVAPIVFISVDAPPYGPEVWRGNAYSSDGSLAIVTVDCDSYLAARALIIGAVKQAGADRGVTYRLRMA